MINEVRKLRVLDLFSGIGGFSRGLDNSGGFETVAFCEIDDHARKILDKHWPNIDKYSDVTKLKYDINGKKLIKLTEDHKETQETPADSIDVICGGFP